LLAPLKNDRLIKALLRQPVDVTPVWMMRQAGRYLPEYRQLRQKAGDFMSLCKNPEFACEATLQPLARFDLDAAILFSDILTIPDAMGLGLHFTAGEGPQFLHPITHHQQVEQLPIPDPEQELRYVPDAVRLIRRELQGRVPLIGFAGSPWTLATYMIEGGPSKTYHLIKTMMYQQPLTLHLLLDKLATATALYLRAQIAAGVQAIMLFDTWGGILTTPAYHEFSLNYMKKIIDSLPRHHENHVIPKIIFTKQGGLWLEDMVTSNCDAVGLDWTIDIGQAKQRIGQQVALQGNMDPALLFASPERIEQEVATILQGFGKGPGHVFNLGHGIHQTTPIENVQVFINAVHELSKPYHQ
jgi:uroporphyrinogen decarboxylase